MKVLVPSDAVSSPLTVHTPNIDVAGIATATFKPLPKITGFGTSPVQAGDLVAINGTNLMPTGTVPTAKLGTTPMSASAFNSQTSISVFVPDAGLTGRVTLTTPNGIATSPTNLAVRPTISGGPTPGDAIAGTTVTFTGKTFTGTASVKFSGNTTPVAASFTIGAGGTSLTTHVPSTAVTGPVTITNAGGATASTSFTDDPKITSFTPSSGTAGSTLVTLTGSGFGASGESRTITVGSVAATSAAYVSPTSVRFTIPDGAPTTGTIHLQVGSGTTADSASSLNVTATLASFTPTHAPAGTSVDITGAGFTGVTAVKFNGVNATTFSVDSATELHATVPGGTTPGQITIARGTAPVLKSGPNFDNESAITAISAKDAQPGQTIVLTGTDLGSADLVTFSGTSATNPPVSADATSVHVVVPVTAEAGPITVHTSLGDAQSADTLVIDPRVDSINPTSGVAGTAVDITGAGLAGVTSVAFNGVPASIIVVHSATSISAQVPDGASTGVITVTRPADAGLGLAAFPADSADTFTFLYAHANGLGQSYTSTDAPSTFSESDAIAAAQAWDAGGGGTLTTGVFCNTSEAAVEMVNKANTQVAVWVYGAGTLQGHVYLNTANSTPLCPTASDPAWN